MLEWAIMYLKLSLKATLSILFFAHVINDLSELVGHHTSVSTGNIVLQGIMDEYILILHEQKTL